MNKALTNAQQLECHVEQYLKERVEAMGGIAEKVTVIGSRGFFDRLIVLPGGKVCFCEVKKPRGSKWAKHQIVRAERYRALGVVVAVVKTRAEVDQLLAGYR